MIRRTRPQLYPFNLAAGALIIAAILCWGGITSAYSKQRSDTRPQRSAQASNQAQPAPAGSNQSGAPVTQPQNQQENQDQQPAQQPNPNNPQSNQTTPLPSDTTPDQGAPSPEINTAVVQHLFATMHAVNQMEIKAGMLARQRGTTQMIRNYGERLVMDHGFADDRLHDFAAVEKIPLPDQPTPIDPQEAQQMQQDQQQMQQLSQMQGKEFDQVFLSMMQQGHDRAIAMLQQKAQQYRTSDVAGFLDKFIPILQQHRELSQHLGRQELARK